MSESIVYGVDQSNELMNHAFEQARSTFKYFWRELYWENRRIIPALDFAMVKVPFFQDSEDGEICEHMWINDIYFDGLHIYGTLVNEPNDLTNVEQGESVCVPVDEISDWMFLCNGIPLRRLHRTGSPHPNDAARARRTRCRMGNRLWRPRRSLAGLRRKRTPRKSGRTSDVPKLSGRLPPTAGTKPGLPARPRRRRLHTAASRSHRRERAHGQSHARLGRKPCHHHARRTDRPRLCPPYGLAKRHRDTRTTPLNHRSSEREH